MVTIKELSDSIGVSKVGITKWIERNGYKDRLQKEGNRYVIPADIEQAIRRNFAPREPKQAEAVRDTNEEKVDVTSEILALLREQLEAKDREIERLHKQVENLQATNADMVKAVRELNTLQAMQLTDGSDRTKGEQRDELEVNSRPTEERSPSEPRRKSFWSRFRRNG